MNILNIKLASVEQTDLGFEHWVDVTYTAPILKETYTIRIMLLLAFKTRDPEVLYYMINEWRRKDIIHHSILMYDQENREI